MDGPSFLATALPDVLIALEAFIAATAHQSSGDLPDQPTARAADARLAEALKFEVDPAWNQPGEITRAGLVVTNLGDLNEIRAEMLGRKSLYARPPETRVLADCLAGFRQAQDAIEKFGPEGSMNPLNRPGPAPQPDLAQFGVLLDASSDWSVVFRAESGEVETAQDDWQRVIAINASARLARSLDDTVVDPRWANLPGLNLFHQAFATIHEVFREMMKSCRVAWTDGRIEPTFPATIDYTDPALDISSPPLQIDPEASARFDRAVASLRRAVDELTARRRRLDSVEPEAAFGAIVLMGELKPPLVFGVEQEPLQPMQHRAVKALVDACNARALNPALGRITGRELIESPNVGNACRKSLVSVREINDEWKAAILTPDGGRGGYRIAPERVTPGDVGHDDQTNDQSK